jgi:hydrogenase maturation factor HypF (carbamoyltransferase family)
MAFVLEVETSSTQHYIKNYIISIVRRFNINAIIKQDKLKIVCAFASEHEKLQECLEAIAHELPASLFLKSSKSYENDETPDKLPELENRYPLNLALCPSCQKEMFDVSSRRYYYPFSSCSCCGGNHSFVLSYPYQRLNSSFKFLAPCTKCKKEQVTNGFKEKHEINSCHDCGVPVRLVNKTSERYANDSGSFRTMFEVAAKAINDNKKLLIKTTFGYRVFYKADNLNNNSILLMINASKITDHLSLITEEYHALLSIERPILNVTLKNEKLKTLIGANTSYVKYPDEGFSILLCTQLQKLNIDYIAYEECDENYEADMIMDYDLEIRPQSDMRVFLNKDDLFIAEGERVSFPSHNFEEKSLLSVGHEYIALAEKGKMLFDNIENFETISINRANVLEGIEEKFYKRQKTFSQDEASFISVIAEHNAFDKRCVGAYFDEERSFLYYDGKNVLRIVPAKKFDGSKIIEDIKNLRDGSDRLVINLEKKAPEIYEKLILLQEKESVKLFEAVAILLGLEDESMRGVTKEAMKFVGKGGIQIDTHVKDNRFDNSAFLASIISYQLAGVSTSILSYSIFESFGDYFNDILQELKAKTKATEIVLCGTHFANQSLFSRMQRNLKMSPPLMNKNYPIGKENAVVGGVFL